jgi:hypothetical protein
MNPDFREAKENGNDKPANNSYGNDQAIPFFREDHYPGTDDYQYKICCLLGFN